MSPLPPSVIVVGAGVSGCACAATLAESGARVTVVNGALDAVGHPGYGPVVEGGVRGWDHIVETLTALPAVLRSVWLEASTAPAVETPFFFVDRRVLSIESKRALECIPGLEFRQGLVTDVRLGLGESPTDDGGADAEQGNVRGVSVATAFGETMKADAIVIAIGLGLDGRVRVGEGVLRGGRHGDVSAEGLRGAMESLGAVLCERSIEVGPWIADRRGEGAATANDVLGYLLERESGAVRRTVSIVPLLERMECDVSPDALRSTTATGWRADYPPAPHRTSELRPSSGVVTVSADGAMEAWLSPDGSALGEIYLPSEVEGSWDAVDDERRDAELAGAPMATRPPHTVTGLVVTNVDGVGRLQTGGRPRLPVWVAGRAGGAADYLESLSSGIRVAHDVWEAMGES